MTTTPPDTEPLFAGQPVLRTAYQQSVAAYWNAERDPVNIRLGEVDGFYHHHYGVGDYDATVLGAPANVRDQAIIAEMHRLESAQSDLLLDQFGNELQLTQMAQIDQLAASVQARTAISGRL